MSSIKKVTNDNTTMSRRNKFLAALGFLTALGLAIILRSHYTTTKIIPFIHTPGELGEADEGYGDIIGIEFGNTISRVAISQGGQIEVIQDQNGRKEVPSVVAFTSHFTHPAISVGHEAQKQPWWAGRDPKNTIYGIRDLIGRDFSDRKLYKEIKKLTYDVVDKDNKPYIKVQVEKGSGSQFFTPEEITSQIFDKLKSNAENFLGRKVTHAVITVPAYFNDNQRQAVKDAAAIAELTCIRLVNEPTAAGIGHALDNAEGGETFDLYLNVGENDLDISLELLDYGVFEILATKNDKILGGKTFDRALVEHVLAEMTSTTTTHLPKDSDTLRQLEDEVRKAKVRLATKPSAKIKVGTFSMTVTQADLHSLHRELFAKIVQTMDPLFKEVKMEKNAIDNIILTGSIEHTNYLKPFLEAHFYNRKVKSDISPDEAIVRGAAIQGGVLSGDQGTTCQGYGYVDISALSLGIEVSGGVFSKIIPRNTVVPTRKALTYTTSQDNQTRINIPIYEGERLIAAENNFQGALVLRGLPALPKGKVEVEVVFEIDADSQFKAVARSNQNHRESTLMFLMEYSRFSQGEIDEIIIAAETHYEEDLRWKEQVLPGIMNGDGKNMLAEKL